MTRRLALLVAGLLLGGAAGTARCQDVPAPSAPADSQATVAARKAPPRKRPARAAAPAGLRLRWVAGLEIIYDDNVLRYSEADLDGFLGGTGEPGQYRLRSTDDLILSPSLELELRHRLLPWGDTRWRARAKRWGYLWNPIKTNSNLAFFVRQDLSAGRSVELSYAYSPEQYIRQLTDRAPFTPAEDLAVWEDFRYTRNGFQLIWRERLARPLSARLTVERVLRYYNRPFLENDITAWGLRGSLAWSVAPRLTLTGDYGWEDDAARGFDQLGETLATSDDSDGSCERDLYQLVAEWRPPLPARWFDAVSLTGQHMSYWYTSTKEITVDPYHVGRKDEVWNFELAFTRACGPHLEVEVAGRWSRRTVRSPWPGEIVSEDKDYIARRGWVGLTWTP